MTPATPPAPPKPGQLVTQVGFYGTRAQLREQIVNHPWPPSWGPSTAISDWVLVNTPSEEKWHGEVMVTAYRTAPTNKGSGTAYLSVRWKPE